MLHAIAHTLAHVLGMDTQQSNFYDFWSGIGTQIAPLVLAAVWYRHHQCHAPGCPKLGRHSHDGTPYCSRHHPEGR